MGMKDPPDQLGEKRSSRNSALVVLGVAHPLVPCAHPSTIHLIFFFR